MDNIPRLGNAFDFYSIKFNGGLDYTSYRRLKRILCGELEDRIGNPIHFTTKKCLTQDVNNNMLDRAWDKL